MICPSDNKTLKAHHDMIHTTFSSTLDRHLLKPVPNHPYYYFYDFIDKLVSLICYMSICYMLFKLMIYLNMF